MVLPLEQCGFTISPPIVGHFLAETPFLSPSLKMVLGSKAKLAKKTFVWALVRARVSYIIANFP